MQFPRAGNRHILQGEQAPFGGYAGTFGEAGNKGAASGFAMKNLQIPLAVFCKIVYNRIVA
jgi:hypothetical protein